jgi:hypothetical protein
MKLSGHIVDRLGEVRRRIAPARPVLVTWVNGLEPASELLCDDTIGVGTPSRRYLWSCATQGSTRLTNVLCSSACIVP